MVFFLIDQLQIFWQFYLMELLGLLTGPEQILEIKGIHAICQKNEQKGQNVWKFGQKMYKIWKYFEKGHVIGCNYRVQ